MKKLSVLAGGVDEFDTVTRHDAIVLSEKPVIGRHGKNLGFDFDNRIKSFEEVPAKYFFDAEFPGKFEFYIITMQQGQKVLAAVEDVE